MPSRLHLPSYFPALNGDRVWLTRKSAHSRPRRRCKQTQLSGSRVKPQSIAMLLTQPHPRRQGKLMRHHLPMPMLHLLLATKWAYEADTRHQLRVTCVCLAGRCRLAYKEPSASSSSNNACLVICPTSIPVLNAADHHDHSCITSCQSNSTCLSSFSRECCT